MFTWLSTGKSISEINKMSRGNWAEIAPNSANPGAAKEVKRLTQRRRGGDAEDAERKRSEIGDGKRMDVAASRGVGCGAILFVHRARSVFGGDAGCRKKNP